MEVAAGEHQVVSAEIDDRCSRVDLGHHPERRDELGQQIGQALPVVRPNVDLDRIHPGTSIVEHGHCLLQPAGIMLRTEPCGRDIATTPVIIPGRRPIAIADHLRRRRPGQVHCHVQAGRGQRCRGQRVQDPELVASVHAGIVLHRAGIVPRAEEVLDDRAGDERPCDAVAEGIALDRGVGQGPPVGGVVRVPQGVRRDARLDRIGDHRAHRERPAAVVGVARRLDHQDLRPLVGDGGEMGDRVRQHRQRVAGQVGARGDDDPVYCVVLVGVLRRQGQRVAARIPAEGERIARRVTVDAAGVHRLGEGDDDGLVKPHIDSVPGWRGPDDAWCDGVGSPYKRRLVLAHGEVGERCQAADVDGVGGGVAGGDRREGPGAGVVLADRHRALVGRLKEPGVEVGREVAELCVAAVVDERQAGRGDRPVVAQGVRRDGRACMGVMGDADPGAAAAGDVAECQCGRRVAGVVADRVVFDDGRSGVHLVPHVAQHIAVGAHDSAIGGDRHLVGAGDHPAVQQVQLAIDHQVVVAQRHVRRIIDQHVGQRTQHEAVGRAPVQGLLRRAVEVQRAAEGGIEVQRVQDDDGAPNVDVPQLQSQVAVGDQQRVDVRRVAAGGVRGERRPVELEIGIAATGERRAS